MQNISSGLILCLLLASCGQQKNTEKACPLVGHWKITGLETDESTRLEADPRKIYQQEVNRMLDSSFVLLTADSSYQLRIGTDLETGRWKWDPADSLLLLEQENRQKSYYILQTNGHQSFKLKKEMDPQHLVLILEHLPH